MKKILLLFAALCCMMVANAQQFVVDNVKYNVTSTEDNTVEVIANVYQGYSGRIEIPAIVVNEGVTYHVTRIGDRAFYDCEYLTSITLPEGLESIGEDAFECCYGLKSITIPSTVKSIEEEAFYDCEYLASVTLPEGLKTIGEEAFEYCYELSSVTLPEDLENIGEDAFYDCESLTSITIPSSVTSIEGNPFGGCSSLASINVAEGNTVYDSRNNCNAIIEKATRTLLSGCSTTVIPSSVTTIGEYAFYNIANLTSITIPNSVTSIGYEAFAYCKNLKSITLPECLDSIGDYLFYECESLTSISIPEGLKSIGNGAFEYCYELVSITIPSSVTEIGEDAFYDCRSLESITIPSSVTEIGDYVFYKCVSLSSISVAEGNTVYDSRDNCNAIIETATNTLVNGCKNTVIPSSVTAIGEYAFYSITSLTSITIPSSVTKIDYCAFYNCTGLKSITFLASNPPTLGDYGFNYVDKSIPVYVPDVDAYSGWGGFTNFIAIDIDQFKKDAIAEINAAKEGVSMSEEEEDAIDSYIAAIEKVETVSDDNLATIEKTKQEAFAIISQAAIRPVREAALAAIEAAMQGETSDYLTGLVQSYIDAINASTDETYINTAKDAAVEALNSAIETYKFFKADILGSLGTKQNGPALIVTDQDGNEIILYSPKSVEYIKVNEK